MEIIRGRMPKVVVAKIKKELADGKKIRELAEKYRTTYGKISDIVKERCFKNVTPDFKITEEDYNAFIKWIEKHDDKEVIAELKKEIKKPKTQAQLQK